MRRFTFHSLMILCFLLPPGGMVHAQGPVSENPVTQNVTKIKDKVLPKMSTDRDMQKVLDAHAKLGPKPIETLTPAEARKQPTITDAVNKVLADEGRDSAPTALVPGVTSKDLEVGGAAGKLPATLYTPTGAGPFPVIVYFHGGGWVIADRKVYDGGARGLAKEAKAIVVSVDYRLAPEHKFPAAHDDALAAYKWVAENAASFGGDPARIALAGESAGGNLALATAIAARDAKLAAPVHVLAVYPVAQPDTNTASYRKFDNAQPRNDSVVYRPFHQRAGGCKRPADRYSARQIAESGAGHTD